MLREEIVDDAAVGLLGVADRLAEQGGRLQQQAFAAVVRFANVLAADRGGRDIADRQVFQQQEALLVAEQAEVDDLTDLLMAQCTLCHRVGQKPLVMIVLHASFPEFYCCWAMTGGGPVLALSLVLAQYWRRRM